MDGSPFPVVPVCNPWLNVSCRLLRAKRKLQEYIDRLEQALETNRQGKLVHTKAAASTQLLQWPEDAGILSAATDHAGTTNFTEWSELISERDQLEMTSINAEALSEMQDLSKLRVDHC
jgi:hypothetical protein